MTEAVQARRSRIGYIAFGVNFALGALACSLNVMGKHQPALDPVWGSKPEQLAFVIPLVMILVWLAAAIITAILGGTGRRETRGPNLVFLGVAFALILITPIANTLIDQIIPRVHP